jgi:hypothetical protein
MEWRPIPGFENYEVSDSGDVRKGDLMRKDYVHTYLKSGYKRVRVCLYKHGKVSTHTVARLVAQAFLPNPDNLPTVDHIDRNSTNNNVTNLRWASRQTQVMNRDPYGASGHKNIYKHGNGWQVQIRRHNQIVFRKSFPTIDEAKAARDNFLN